MTNEELIKLLQQFPKDDQVDMIDNCEGICIGTITNVFYDNESKTIILEN